MVAKANEAADEVRRPEAKTRPELKRSRYVWLKNETNLTARHRETLAWLSRPSEDDVGVVGPGVLRVRQRCR